MDMIYSGADLIRTSGQQQERLDRLKVVPNEQEVKPPEKSAQTKSSLDEETQGALLRFARFINKENKENGPKKDPPKKLAPKGPADHPYKKSMSVLNRAMDSGLTIDIYV